MSVDGFGGVRCWLRLCRSRRRVHPSTCVGSGPRRAIAGMGHVGRLSTRRAARRRPWAGVSWWKTSRTCPVTVGDVDTDMRLICREGLTEAFLLTWGEPVARGAQKKPDLVEGIACASTVSGRVLLDAAEHLTWGITGECDDVTGAWHAGGILGAGQAMAFLLPLGRGSSLRFALPHGSLVRARPASSHARCQTFPGPGPLNLAVG